MARARSGWRVRDRGSARSALQLRSRCARSAVAIGQARPQLRRDTLAAPLAHRAGRLHTRERPLRATARLRTAPAAVAVGLSFAFRKSVAAQRKSDARPATWAKIAARGAEPNLHQLA